MAQPTNSAFNLLVEIAALDFEPCLPNADIKPPPSDEEWTQMAQTILVYTRVAWLMLHKTKAEVRSLVGAIGPDGAVNFAEGIDNAEAFLDAMKRDRQGAVRTSDDLHGAGHWVGPPG